MTSPSDPPLQGWTAIVLAAGRGTRMRSKLPKVLHPVCGRPMVHLVCDTLQEAGIDRIVGVVASADDAVAEALGERAAIAVQSEPLGTGHAVLAAREAVGEAPRVLILYADLPLLTLRTLREITARHVDTTSILTFLTAFLEDPTGYGRIIRKNGRVQAIVEESDTDDRTRREREVNGGLYATETAWLWPTLEAVEPGPKGERYLTDIMRMAVDAEERVQTYQVTESTEVQQVNTRLELSRAERVLRDRIRTKLMLGGVTLVNPEATYVDVGVTVGADTTLLPGVYLLGSTTVGGGCRIGPNAVLRDTTVADDCEIGGSTLEETALATGVTVGPYCHLRPGSVIERDVQLGNYAEVKASHIGPRTRVGHFSYIGDAEVGADVNIGAGTVTANFDGHDKHRTRIGDGAFIGSDSMLVAPIVIGAGARTSAGSVVTRDVPAGASAIGSPARIRASDGAPAEDENVPPAPERRRDDGEGA